MSLLDYFRSNKKQNTAQLAKERLQIIVAHERSSRGGPDYLPQLKQDILDVIRKYVQIDPDKITAKMVLDVAKAGDEVGTECFEIMVDKLTNSFANVIDLIDPAVFTIGGGVANAGDFLLDALKDGMEGKITYPELVDPDIRLASLGNDAGIVGAAYVGDYIVKK